MGVAQPIIDDSQTTTGNSTNQVVHEIPYMVEPTLRRSTRIRRSVILDDYIVCLQELNNDLGAENNPLTFSQAMN